MATTSGKTPSVVGKSTIIAASNGEQSALQQVLTQLVDAQNKQATQTNTSSKNPPNQSTATVVFQNPLYIVTFTDPGGSSASSLQQAQQQAASLSIGSNPTQSVIYHQLQVATSVVFDAAAGLETYGGVTGSLNTQFVIGDLDASKSYFFRIRTSFDGINWNQWFILNNKKATTENPNAVIQEPITGGTFATITLPGGQTVGFGIAQVPSGAPINTAQGILISNCLGIVGPATVNDTGNRVAKIEELSINSLGITNLTYEDLGSNTWDGQVNYLIFGWTVGSQNITVQTLGDGGKWVVITIAGGLQIAFGYGGTAPGQTFDLPAGFVAANTMAVCTPASGNPIGDYAHGIKQSDVTACLPTVLYGDGSGHQWTGNANWFCMAFPAALAGNVVTVAGGKYLLFPTPSGTIAIGVGSVPNGSALPMPLGYGFTADKCIAFATPGSYNDIGSYMHGMKICTVQNQGYYQEVFCIYTDGTEAVWDGNANFFSVCWQ